MSATATSGRTLVIGYGNPLREDDGVGWRVAEQLASEFDPVEVLVMTCHQLTPELADPIAHAGLVVFVDASATAAPGRVDCHAVRLTEQTTHALNHATAPAELLRGAQTIFGHSPPAFVVTIGGERFGFGEKLSGPVAAAIPQVIRQVVRVISQHEAEHASHA